MDKRLRYFDEGASTLRPVLERLGIKDALPKGRDFYACPCCLIAYPREAVGSVLTIEHAPPEKLGGREMLLTCARCNHGSGAWFDQHAASRSKAESFLSGKNAKTPFPATFHVDGIPLRGKVQWDTGGIRFSGVQRRNNPKVRAAHLEALNAYVDSKDENPNYSLTVHTPRFDEARARISWIRAAYLIAFSALGWSYIFRKEMDPFRRQLAQLEEITLPTYIFHNSKASPTENRVLLVSAPEELRCVAVVMGQRTVFLPAAFRPLPLEGLLEAFKHRREAGDLLSVGLAGKEVPWPTWPTYFLDGP